MSKEVSDESEFKQRLRKMIDEVQSTIKYHIREFGPDGELSQDYKEEQLAFVNEARSEIMANFSCLPKLQNVLLKWFRSAEKK
jgi:hypothetical protein